jgi:hypothetical protein
MSQPAFTSSSTPDLAPQGETAASSSREEQARRRAVADQGQQQQPCGPGATTLSILFRAREMAQLEAEREEQARRRRRRAREWERDCLGRLRRRAVADQGRQQPCGPGATTLSILFRAREMAQLEAEREE